MQHDIEFVTDSSVNSVLNEKLITILSICFPHQPIFKMQRYFKEVPNYRWFIESENQIIAHVALHEKVISIDGIDLNIGAIAEVCVHPDHRRKGLVKELLIAAHNWLKENKYKYAMLFGEEDVYKSSGYFNVTNEIKYLDYNTKKYKIEKNIDAMVKLLSDASWIEGLIDLNGPTF
jgi:predicted acetyltransferase